MATACGTRALPPKFETGPLVEPALSKRELAMRGIIQANIARFKELLKTETDPTKRAMEKRLLAEEEAKEKHLPVDATKETKAY